MDVSDRLAFNLRAVDLQRNRHRAEIFGLRQSIQRTGLTRIRQLIAHLVAVVGVQCTRRFAKAQITSSINDLLRDVDWQANCLCNRGYVFQIGSEHCLDQNIADHHG